MLKPQYRVYLFAFLLDAALMVGFAPAPFYMFDHLGGGAAMSGTVTAFQFGLYAVACLVSSRLLAQSQNSLRYALIGLTMYAVLFPASLLVRSPYFFGAMTVAGFASLSLVWPATQSWIGGEPDPKRMKRSVAIYNISWTLGLALGALAGGPLYDYDYRLPFLVVFVLAAIGFGLLASLPHERAYHAQPATSSPSLIPAQPISRAYLYNSWIANLVGCALIGSSRAVFAKRVEELVDQGSLFLFSNAESGIPFLAAIADIIRSKAATQFAWLVFAMCAARALAFLTLGSTRWWQGRFSFLVLFQILAAGAFWVMGSTHSLAVMGICYLVLGVNGGVGYFASLHCSLSDPAHKRSRAAVHESMVGLGNFTGGLAFGLFAMWFGTTWPFRYTPLFILAALLAQGLIIFSFKPHHTRYSQV